MGESGETNVKRPLGAFIIYSNEVRPGVMNKYPDLKYTEIASKIGEMWRGLAEEDKDDYKRDAAERLAKWKEENPNPPPRKSKKREAAAAEGKKKKKKDPNAPKGALSAYMFFFTEVRPKIREENPDVSFGDIGKLVGKAWSELTPDKRVKFAKMAAEDKERYQTEMADYKKDGDDYKSESD